MSLRDVTASLTRLCGIGCRLFSALTIDSWQYMDVAQRAWVSGGKH
jgi:hypothetical protein